MNLLQLTQRLKRLSLRSTGTGVSPATLSNADAEDLSLADYVNDEWMDLQRENYLWRWMRRELDAIPLAAGTSILAGPDALILAGSTAANFGRWKRRHGSYSPSFWITGGNGHETPLEFAPWDDFRARYVVGPQRPGGPVHWSIDSSERLRIGPAPAVDITLRADYYRAPTSMTAEADVPTDLPVDFHLMLAWGALRRVAIDDAAPELQMKGQANWDSIHSDLVRLEAENTDDWVLGTLA